MDPITHALAGCAAARVLASRPFASSALLPGMVGGLLPDVDALIRSAADPLLAAEYHRHFTHSLAFIPAGGVMAALPWLLARRTRPRWKAYVGAATAGYATHGLLDACTTYGTLLLWPFSLSRVGWDVIAIVDPLFTLGLLASVGIALARRTALPCLIALLACTAYLGLGTVQRDRALDAQARMASARGHMVVRRAVFPGIGANLVWRSLYLANGALHMDRIRVPWSDPPAWKPGTHVPVFLLENLPTLTRQNRQVARDIRRFQWFADGWVATSPADPDVIADARYSEAVDRFEPVWGIRVTVRTGGAEITWVDRSRDRRIDLHALWDELRGNDPHYRPVPR